MEYLKYIISNKHIHIKEKMLFYKDVVSLVYSKDFDKKVEPIFEFFIKKILPHFKIEELIFLSIEKYLTVKEQKIVKKIIDEHIIVLKQLNELKDFVLEKDMKSLKIKEMFKTKFKKIVNIIFKHTELEDKKLFPIYKKYVGENVINKILKSSQLKPYVKEELKKELGL